MRVLTLACAFHVKPEPVTDHCDKFGIGRFATCVVNGVAKVRI